MDVKEEVRSLDKMVRRLNLPRFVCSSRSEHSGKGIPSEMVFDMDGMFFVKRVAQKKFGVDNGTLREWSANDCKQFYIENNLSKYDWDDVEVGVEWWLASRMGQYTTVFVRRWGQDMLFTDYRERVNMLIGSMEDELRNECEAVAKRISQLHAQKVALNKEQEFIVNNYDMSDRMRKILGSVNIEYDSLDLDD